MKTSQGILNVFAALTTCLMLHSSVSYASYCCSSAACLDQVAIAEPECQGYSPSELSDAVSNVEQFLVAAKEANQWPEESLTLLSSLIKENRIQESIWLLNRYHEHQLGDHLEASLKHLLQCAPVASKQALGGGATQTWLLNFDHTPDPQLQIQAVYKPQQANLSSHVGSEVATYLVDRLLKTDLVPLTISRVIDSHKPGSIQYFIKDAKKISDPSLDDRNKHKSAQMYLLDFLTKNIDRGDYFSEKKIKFEYNYLYLPSLNQLIAIDNSWALRGNNVFAKLKGYWVDKRHRYERRYSFPEDKIPDATFYRRLKNLETQTLQQSLEGVISQAAINKIIKRKLKVLKAFEKTGRFPT